jgi:predicted RNA binding protein YcfA (HicA-like mRNA interferase family)
MAKIPVLSSQIVIKTLVKAGYIVVRQKGSHIRLQHAERKPITVPRHPLIGKGLLKKILRDSEISSSDFKKLL